MEVCLHKKKKQKTKKQTVLILCDILAWNKLFSIKTSPGRVWKFLDNFGQFRIVLNRLSSQSCHFFAIFVLLLNGKLADADDVAKLATTVKTQFQ